MDLRIKNLSGLVFGLAVIAALVYGWQLRDSNYITAESGAGYALGIVGGSMMLILLLYPVSKRIKWMTRLVPLRYWFGVHMMLGVLGPVMILFHSNFHLGSVNSNVALICMLIVASSGLIGRYMYTRIHHGLYGSKIQMKELKDELSEQDRLLSDDSHLDSELQQQLHELEAKATEAYTGLFRSIGHVRLISSQVKHIDNQIDKRTLSPDTLRAIDRYMSGLKKIGTFRLYERLFALWHILHLPLFIMMLITAVIHIYAVHIY